MYDPCLFLKITEESTVMLGVWVDDCILIGNNSEELTKIYEQLSNSFKAKDLGKLSFMLGVQIEVDHKEGTVSLSQRGQIQEKVEKFNQEHGRPVKTPLDPGTKLDRRQDNEDKTRLDKIPYREAVGGFSYIARMIRPELSQALGLLGRFSDSFDESHWNAAKRVYK